MTPDLKTLRSVVEEFFASLADMGDEREDGPTMARYFNAQSDFAQAFSKDGLLSLLDRVEALEERDDLAMQIISENAKLRREAEAMAETVRTLEAERDRLREGLEAARVALTFTTEQFTAQGPGFLLQRIRQQALPVINATLNPSTGVEGGGS